MEVDYAGDPIGWIDLKTGEIRKAGVFVAGLGFSQLLFAWAAEDMKSRNWLNSHRRMFAFYGGVAHVTVPDCLKQGVLKCHWYDPDLNPRYAELAAEYSTAVVPARPDHPKDKAIVEGLMKILMRYVRFRHWRRRFTSLTEVNRELAECVERINERRHTRFGRLAPRALRSTGEIGAQILTRPRHRCRGLEGGDAACRLLRVRRG